MGRAFEYRRAAKEKRWNKMSKVFPKLAKAITFAAKDGGEDPELNPRLRMAILNAKAQNMPKDNIEAAIKRAAGKDAATISQVSYEGKAPHGVMIFVECATDNTNRTVVTLRTYLNKSGGQLLDNGSLEFLFTRRAQVEFVLPDGTDHDEIELNLIDYGLEEIEFQDGAATAYGEYSNFAKLSHGVEALGYELTKAELRRIPTSPVELTEEQMGEIESLLDKIEDDDDVQAVFTNIA